MAITSQNYAQLFKATPALRLFFTAEAEARELSPPPLSVLFQRCSVPIFNAGG